MGTVFSMQRFIEDFLIRQGLDDLDQYAVSLANLYDEKRSFFSQKEFLARMYRIRTVMFKNKQEVGRSEIEKILLTKLDQRFQKKNSYSQIQFPGGVAPECKRLHSRLRTIKRTLLEFKKAVEARAIDGFWRARSKHQLRSKPECIAQTFLAVFLKGVIGDRGFILREFMSGIGFVDVGILFGCTMHLIELKILEGSLSGDLQLAKYMENENRSSGWLLLFDARRRENRGQIPVKQIVNGKKINIMVIDINPLIPSKIKH